VFLRHAPSRRASDRGGDGRAVAAGRAAASGL